MKFPLIRVRDKQNNHIHIVGSDVHDQLIVRDGSIHYMNLQNGEGTGEHGDYEFVASENGEFLPEIEFQSIGELQHLDEVEAEREDQKIKMIEKMAERTWREDSHE